jgi:formylglycine-generating enzyme required for sulfatase activity
MRIGKVVLVVISFVVLISCVKDIDIDIDMAYVSPEFEQSIATSAQLQHYFIGKYQITKEEWVSVMKHNSTGYKRRRVPLNGASLEEIQAFILTLNEITGEDYRLPTNVEWKYATKNGFVDSMINKPNSLGFRLAIDAK